MSGDAAQAAIARRRRRDRRAGDGGRVPGAAAVAGADGARLRRAAGRRDRDRARVRADGRAAALVLARPRSDGGVRRLAGAAALARIARRVARGAREIIAAAGPRSVARDLGRAALRSAACGPPACGACSSPGLVLAAARLGRRHADRVQSDVTKLVPSNMPALRDLRTLERVTGVSGEIDVLVSASDVATPTTIGWMVGYESTLLAHYGYVEAKGCCARDAVPGAVAARPVLLGRAGAASCAALADPVDIEPAEAVPAVLLPGGDHARPPGGDARVRDPPDAAGPAAAGDRLHARAPASAVRGRRLAGRPARAGGAGGRGAVVVGAPDADVLAGLFAVGLVLFAVLRTVARALVPLVPIALATGWSSLILFAMRIPLNPMSATLGALVIAISTEFSVLLSERYRAERRRAWRRGRRWRGPTGSPARPCSRRGSPRSPGSGCSRSRASRCCATSGW